MTSNDQWLNSLISPSSGQALHYQAANAILVSRDGTEKYPLVDGVPQLLPVAPEQVRSQSEAHQKLDSTFHYREHYRNDAEVFDYFLAYEDGAGRHEARRLHETIARQVPSATETILDVGCGSAWVAQQFCPRGTTVVSMDIAPKNPQKALEQYAYSNHFAVVADVYCLPFPPASFDCIIASEVIEHVADPRLFIERLMGVLRPGGKLIVTTPYNEKIPYSLCIHCNRPTPQHAHLHSFTQDNLAQLVRRDQVQSLNMQTFNNKALTKLQTHVFLQYFPAGIWRIVDRAANVVIRKPARLMMCLIKRD